MTREELAEIERAEFEGAIRELVHEPAFVALIVPWVYRARAVVPRGPVNESHLPTLNWAAGQANQITELMDEVERLDQPAHSRIMERVSDYARRVRDAE